MAWYNYSIGHGYITDYQGPGTDTPHYADDVETPFHTPITSLFEGTVEKADYQPWGGEVFIKTNVPGIGPTEEYFYHLDDIDPQIRKGYHVKRGEEIGFSGGQQGYGDHPVQNTSDVTWSTGPHTHVGFFSKYKSVVEGGKTIQIPYGPDITPYLGTGGAPAQGTSGDACLACGPKSSDPNSAYIKCTAQVAIGWVPDCAAAAVKGGGPCDQRYPVGLTTPQNIPLNFLCQIEQGLGVESNTDLLYRMGFIGAGVLFIIFGLMIFSRGFMQNVQSQVS